MLTLSSHYGTRRPAHDATVTTTTSVAVSLWELVCSVWS